jgi:methylmalonyl-CoA mutase cobalamin-binding subunit
LLPEGSGNVARHVRNRTGASPMRDNGIPYAPANGGLETYAGLAQDALSRLIAERGHGGAVTKHEHLDHFMRLLIRDTVFDPAVVLAEMAARRLDPAAIASHYVPEAARLLGERWLSDQISFVDVTVGTERLHAVVRRVDEAMDEAMPATGPSALILVAEAEQHTLGAFVLAFHLRTAGFSATVRVAPGAAELSQLMAAKRFDLALVSLGCSTALESGVALVRSLRRFSERDMMIYVGGAIPVPDDRLLRETRADRVLRDVSALLAEFDPSRPKHVLDGPSEKGLEARGKSAAKGDGVEA